MQARLSILDLVFQDVPELIDILLFNLLFIQLRYSLKKLNYNFIK